MASTAEYGAAARPSANLVAHAAWAALRIGRSDLLDDPEVRTRPPVLDERGRWHAALAADPIRETG